MPGVDLDTTFVVQIKKLFVFIKLMAEFSKLLTIDINTKLHNPWATVEIGLKHSHETIFVKGQKVSYHRSIENVQKTTFSVTYYCEGSTNAMTSSVQKWLLITAPYEEILWKVSANHSHWSLRFGFIFQLTTLFSHAHTTLFIMS